MQTLPGFDALFKEDYEGPVRDLIESEARGYYLFSERDRETSGRDYLVPMTVRGSGAAGARRDNAVLPAAGQSTYVDSKAQVKFNYGVIEVTDPTIKLSRNSVGAFTKAIEITMSDMVRDVVKKLNFQTYNDGSGARAMVNETPSSDAIMTIDNPYGLAQPVTTGALLTQHFEPGMVCAVGSARWNPTIRLFADGTAFATITAVDDTNATITFDKNIGGGSATIANNDFIFEVGSPTTVANTSASVYSDHVEIMGLLGLVSDEVDVGLPTSIQGLARSTYARALGASVRGTYSATAGSGTPLTEPQMRLMFDLANKRGGGKIDVLLGEHSMRREYAKLLQHQVRYTNTMAVDGSVFKEDYAKNRGKQTTLEFEGKPFMFDTDCPWGTIFYLDLTSIERISACPIEWADDDGAVLARHSTKAAWTAWLRVYFNLAASAPNKNAVQRGVLFSFTEA